MGSGCVRVWRAGRARCCRVVESEVVMNGVRHLGSHLNDSLSNQIEECSALELLRKLWRELVHGLRDVAVADEIVRSSVCPQQAGHAKRELDVDLTNYCRQRHKLAVLLQISVRGWTVSRSASPTAPVPHFLSHLACRRQRAHWRLTDSDKQKRGPP